MRTRKNILTMAVDVTSLGGAVNAIAQLARQPCASYVCVSNVHMCIETLDNPRFREVVNGAELVVADGRPIYLAQKLLGASQARQVRGMDLTEALCQLAHQENIPVGFYGGEAATLATLQTRLRERYPGITIGVAISPPFRQLSAAEEESYIAAINRSGTKILFVGLGCPKQEQWMARHKAELACVMVGVGAAFDFIAGNKRHAPRIMQLLALEWLYRLCSEPGRLWRRYSSTNPRFIWYFLQQLLGRKFP